MKLLIFYAAVVAVCYGDLGALQEKYTWKSLDFAYPSEEARNTALADESFIVQNNIPTGISVYNKNKIFVSIPRNRKGVPATLAYFSQDDSSSSPVLIPYPSFAANNISSCDNLISVNRGMRMDAYNRLWVVDSGKIGGGKSAVQLCPPKIVLFDVLTDSVLLKYTLKDSDYSSKSVFKSVVVDIGSSADTTFLYIAEQTGLIVYSIKDNDSWRFDHPYFNADPMSTNYNIEGLNFQWNNVGIFGMALSPKRADDTRTLYFHSLSGTREFSVCTSVLKDKSKVQNSFYYFNYVGIRDKLGRSSSEVFASNGVLFFNLIDKNAVGCWNSALPYVDGQTLAVVAQDDEKLIFPTDSVVDRPRQEDSALWILSNRLPIRMYGKMDFTDTNFRILSAPVKDIIAGTVCNPSYVENY